MNDGCQAQAMKPTEADWKKEASIFFQGATSLKHEELATRILAGGEKVEEIFFAELVKQLILQEKRSQKNSKKDFAESLGSVCQLGTRIMARQKDGSRGAYGGGIASLNIYLLSIANTEELFIRLNILSYFGKIYLEGIDHYLFEKMVSRSGFTSLTHLLYLLKNPKTSNAALSYISDNWAAFLSLPEGQQMHLHNCLKDFLFKEPILACGLIKKLVKTNLQEKGKEKIRKKIFIFQLVGLTKVAAELGRMELVASLLIAIEELSNRRKRNEIIRKIVEKGLGSQTITLKLRGFLRPSKAELKSQESFLKTQAILEGEKNTPLAKLEQRRIHSLDPLERIHQLIAS